MDYYWLTIDQVDRLLNRCAQPKWCVSCMVWTACKWISNWTFRQGRHFYNFEADRLWNYQFLFSKTKPNYLSIRLLDWNPSHANLLTNRKRSTVNLSLLSMLKTKVRIKVNLERVLLHNLSRLIWHPRDFLNQVFLELRATETYFLMIEILYRYIYAWKRRNSQFQRHRKCFNDIMARSVETSADFSDIFCWLKFLQSQKVAVKGGN